MEKNEMASEMLGETIRRVMTEKVFLKQMDMTVWEMEKLLAEIPADRLIAETDGHGRFAAKKIL